jgi:hypothetical protein
MRNYNEENHLEMIELYAHECGLISSEDDLSERFDNEVMPSILGNYNKSKPGKAFTDQHLVNEAFNNWTDSLCKDGEIHPLQYDEYGYIGEWSNI